MYRDHIYTDAALAKLRFRWRTALIVRELEEVRSAVCRCKTVSSVQISDVASSVSHTAAHRPSVSCQYWHGVLIWTRCGPFVYLKKYASASLDHPDTTKILRAMIAGALS